MLEHTCLIEVVVGSVSTRNVTVVTPLSSDGETSCDGFLMQTLLGISIVLLFLHLFFFFFKRNQTMKADKRPLFCHKHKVPYFVFQF